MPQSLCQIWLHLVFSTKNRAPYLRNVDFRTEMFCMLAHNVKETSAISAAVGGWEDHVHLLVGLPRTLTVAKLVEAIKTETSKWAKDVEHGNRLYAWQAGYGVFSVSHSNMDKVLEYISKQDERHAKLTYQQEFRQICKRHSVPIDEQYVWD